MNGSPTSTRHRPRVHGMCRPVRPPAPAPVSGGRRGRCPYPGRSRRGTDPGAERVAQLSRLPIAKSRVSLIVVSVLIARWSLWYCLILECL